MLNSVEELRQIEINSEAIASADRPPDLLGCSVSRASGPKPVARFREAGIEHRGQDLFDVVWGLSPHKITPMLGVLHGSNGRRVLADRYRTAVAP